MKRNLFIVITLVLFVFALTGCNKDSGNSSSDSKDSATTYKVGFSQGTMNHPFRVAMVEEFENYMKENHPEVEVLITDGENNSSTQVSDVETLISQGIDLLAISPLTSDALTPAVADAMEAGIPVITVDREVNTPVTVHVGANNSEIGKVFGDYIVNELKNGGKVIEIQGTAGSSATIERHEGFLEAIEGSDVEVIAEQHADYLRDPAMNFMEDMLQRFSEPNSIQAVYAHNDEMGLGAISAIQAAGRLDEIKVFSIDGQNNAFEAVEEGTLSASANYPHGGRDAAELAIKVLNGEDIEELIELEFDIVDESNVDEFLGKGI